MRLARRMLLCTAVLVVLVGGHQPAGAGSSRPAPKPPQAYGFAAYEWHPANRLTTGQVRNRLQFLRRHGFKTVYLDVGPYIDVADLPDSEEKGRRIAELRRTLKRYVRYASAMKLAVHAVGGGPDWTGERRRYLGAMLVHLVADYNAAVTARERLAGVHLDIEPYAEPSFFHDVQASLTAYLETIQEIVLAYRQRAVGSANSRLELGFAIPFWFDAGPEAPGPVLFGEATKPAVHHLIDMIRDLPRAYLQVMAYRWLAAGTDGTIAHALAEFRYASAVRARSGLVVGQQYTNVRPSKITFHGRSRRTFMHQAAQVVKAFARYPQFRGLSVDDVDAYMAAR
jgi:hypothetical protein